MKNNTLILMVSLLMFYASSAYGQNWNRTNPGGGGWMMSVGAGPTGTILVGSDLSGAYRSTDGGQNWDAIGAASGLTATHVGTVGFDPIDGDILYLGTNRGIYRSNNGGDTMVHVFDPGNAAKAVSDIKISLANPTIGYAAYHPQWNGLEGVIYKTTDRGLTWSQISIDLPDDLRLLKIIIHPNDSETVYVLSGRGRFACGPAELYRSDNGGVNWTKLASSISDTIRIMDVAIDPIDPANLYLTTMDIPCNQGVSYQGDIYKSTDGGNSWFDPNPDANQRSGVIWINRENPSIIKLIDVRKTAPWIPTSGTFTSLDGGISWTQTGDETNWDTFYHNGLNDNDLGSVIHNSYGNNLVYCRTLGEDLSDPDKMYWINKRFVYGTDDGGTIFNNLFTRQDTSGGWQSTGIDNVVLFDIEISEADPNIVYAGFADNGLWRSLNAGLSWESCNNSTFTDGWGGYGGNVYSIAPDPNRADVVWAAMRGTNNCHLVKSNDRGEISSWTLSNNGLPPSSKITDISIDPNSDLNNRTLFTILSGNIYKSLDDGLNWSLSDSIGGLSFIEVDPSNSDIIYAGGSSGFFRTINGGQSWSETGHIEMSEPGNTTDFYRKAYRGVSSIHPSLCEPGILYVTAYGPSKGLYKSIDYGLSWVKLRSDNHMRSVVVSENNHQVILTGSSFVGYSGGFVHPNLTSFQFSLDGGVSWITDDAALAFPSIVDLELNHSNPEKIFAVSQGTGIQWAYDWVAPYTYFADTDNDSFGDTDNSTTSCLSSPPTGYVSNDTDCNDGNPDVNPDAIEICNSYDDNCNDLLNEGLKRYTYFADDDHDSYGDPNSPLDTCLNIAPLNFVVDSTDCDDSNPNINPAAIEILSNGIDEDCNGTDLLNQLENLETNLEVQIFPNPFKDNISISCECNTLIRIEIVNILGLSIQNQTYQMDDHQTKLDLSALQKGVYWMKIYLDDGKLLHIQEIVKPE